ncbi:hypothetical protein PFISCL1PPCAC_9683, partial [Pristionchus fissidentatus]
IHKIIGYHKASILKLRSTSRTLQYRADEYVKIRSELPSIEEISIERVANRLEIYIDTREDYVNFFNFRNLRIRMR